MGNPNPLNVVEVPSPPGTGRDATGGAQHAAGSTNGGSTGGFHFFGTPVNRNRDGRATSDRNGRRERSRSTSRIAERRSKSTAREPPRLPGIVLQGVHQQAAPMPFMGAQQQQQQQPPRQQQGVHQQAAPMPFM